MAKAYGPSRRFHGWSYRGLAVAALMGAAAAGYGAETLDAVVATVDKEVILRSDIMQEIAPYLSNLQYTVASEEAFNREAEAQFQATLNQAVENKILLRQALLAGASVTDEQVEARIEEIRKRYPSNEAFLKVLEEAGETMSDFRTHVRKQILAISMGMTKRREFEADAVISEADVAQYYQDNKSRFEHPERVRLRRIFLSASQDAQERERVRARLVQLRGELEAGADFGALAKAYSEGPGAENGGDMGWRERGDLEESLETPAFSLSEGATSDLIETDYGFLLLKIDGKEAAAVPSLDEVRKEIEPELRARYADERYAKWMAELRKQSRVRIFF